MKTKAIQLQRLSKFLCIAFAIMLTQSAFAQKANLKSHYTEENIIEETSLKKVKPVFTVTLKEDLSSHKFVLLVNNPGQRNLWITVTNSLGELFSDKVNDASYNRLFNLAEVEDGEYTINITNGSQNFEKRIAINTYTGFNRRIHGSISGHQNQRNIDILSFQFCEEL